MKISETPVQKHQKIYSSISPDKFDPKHVLIFGAMDHPALENHNFYKAIYSTANYQMDGVFISVGHLNSIEEIVSYVENSIESKILQRMHISFLKKHHTGFIRQKLTDPTTCKVHHLLSSISDDAGVLAVDGVTLFDYFGPGPDRDLDDGGCERKNKKNMFLKINGLWENNTDIGIHYSFCVSMCEK